MPISNAVVRPPYAVIIVGDPACEPPESLGGQLIGSTSSCVAIGTLSDVDGDTRIRMLDAEDAVNLPAHLVFEGELELPTRRVTIMSVLGSVYLERQLDSPSVSVQIWVNDQEEPDNIAIVITRDEQVATGRYKANG
jgi:hypothetical protein